MKTPGASIPECPAYEVCRAKKTDCRICETLDVATWREHVKKVLRTVTV